VIVLFHDRLDLALKPAIDCGQELRLLVFFDHARGGDDIHSGSCRKLGMEQSACERASAKTFSTRMPARASKVEKQIDRARLPDFADGSDCCNVACLKRYAADEPPGHFSGGATAPGRGGR